MVLSASSSNDKGLMHRVAQKLAAAGTNETLARMYGKALYLVISKQWFDIAMILIQKGADVNFYEKYADPSTDVYGVALNASLSSDKELMEMIVQKLATAGTNEALARMYGKALDNVLSKQWFDIALQLVKKGASLDELGKEMRERWEHYAASLQQKMEKIEQTVERDVDAVSQKVRRMFGVNPLAPLSASSGSSIDEVD